MLSLLKPISVSNIIENYFKFLNQRRKILLVGVVQVKEIFYAFFTVGDKNSKNLII